MAGMMGQSGFGAPAMPGGINAAELPPQVKQALIQQLLAKRAQAGQAPVPGQIAIDPVALSGTAMTPSPMAVPKFGDGVQQPSTQGFTQNPPAMPSADAPAPGAVNAGPAVGGNVTPPPAAPMAGPMMGLGNDGQSYDSIQRKRKLAQEMMKSGTDASPVGHWTQALARVAGAGVGKYLDNKLDTSEKETNKAIIAALTGRSAQPATPGQNVTNQPGQPPQGTLSAYAQAVAKVESGGRYDATGPQTRSGDRAYGKYQVMGANIPQWTKEVLGQSMTPQQFLANPQAQDAVFNQKFRTYMAQYGNPNDAVSMWFSGKPLAAAGNRSDGYNTVPQYLKKVLAALPGGGAQAANSPGTAPPQQAAAGGIGGLSPQAMMAMAFDPRVSPQMRQGILAMAQMQAQQGKVNYQTLPDGTILALDPNGRRPPTPVYQAAQKPMLVGENQRLINPTTGQAIGPEPQAGRTTAQKDYEAYTRQVPPGQKPLSFIDYQERLKRAGSAQPESSFNVEMAKGQAKSFTEMAGEFPAARTDIANIKLLRNQLDKLPGGAMGNVQAMAVRMGIKLGSNASAIEAADAIINRLTPAQRQGMPGASSDRDVAMFRGALPTLGQTKEGQKIILDTMEAMASYKLSQAQIAQQVAMGRMKPEAAMEALAKLPDPFQTFRAMQGQQQGAAASAQPQGAQAGAPQISSAQGKVRTISREEYQSIPSGSQFIAADDPTQTIRVKP